MKLIAAYIGKNKDFKIIEIKHPDAGSYENNTGKTRGVAECKK